MLFLLFLFESWDEENATAINVYCLLIWALFVVYLLPRLVVPPSCLVEDSGGILSELIHDVFLVWCLLASCVPINRVCIGEQLAPFPPRGFL